MYGNVENFSITSDHLAPGGIVKIGPVGTTSIKYSVTITRSLQPSGGWNWYPVDMVVGLGYEENGFKFFTGQTAITSSQFNGTSASLTVQLTSLVDATKLPVGSKIYLVIENHPPGLPPAGWVKGEFLSLNYSFQYVNGPSDPGTPGVPPSYTAPIAGSVALFEYTSELGCVLSTTYYSSYPGYTYKGIFGFVFSSPTTGTVPLYRYKNYNNAFDNYYSITTVSNSNYGYVGIIGYVYGAQVTKTLPVYVHHKSTNGGVYKFENYPTSYLDFANNGIRFYVVQPKQLSINLLPDDDWAELYEYYNASGTDHYYTTIKKDHGNWSYVKVLAYISRIQRTGTVALHQYWNIYSADHYYTTQKQDYGNYRYEGVAGWVYPTSTSDPSILGVYSYWSTQQSNHYYSFSYSPPSFDYAWEGIKFYLKHYPY